MREELWALPALCLRRLKKDEVLRRLLLLDRADPFGADAPTEADFEAACALPIAESAFAAENGGSESALPPEQCRVFLQELLPVRTNSASTLQLWVDGLESALPGVLLGVELKLRILCHGALEPVLTPAGLPASRSFCLLERCLLDLSDPPAAPGGASLPDPALLLPGIGPLRLKSCRRLQDNRERCGYELSLTACF